MFTTGPRGLQNLAEWLQRAAPNLIVPERTCGYRVTLTAEIIAVA
jgi:hypothetical protein